MTTYVVGTNSVHTSAALCDYLQERIDEPDTIHAVNSQFGGDETSSEDIRDGEDALNAIRSRLGGVATVETHQFVRGNEPAEDILDHAREIEADEIVLGIRKRDMEASGLVFGSVARDVLHRSDLPMAVVPRENY